MSEQLDNILRSETKGIENATGPLSRLIRRTWIDLNIGPNQWETKLNRYLASKHCSIPSDDISKRSSFKGNLDKALVRPDLTWEVFLLAVKVMGGREQLLTFRLLYPDTDRYFASSEFTLNIATANKRSLANLYEDIMVHYQILPSRWSDLVSRYINNTSSIRPGDSAQLSWLKGNIKSKIRDNNLSIKNLTTILSILNPQSVQLTLSLKWNSGMYTLHTVKFTSRDSFGNTSEEQPHAQT